MRPSGGQTGALARHLTIVLPGRAYGALGPAIRLPVLALEEVGAETAIVGYPAGAELPEGPSWWESFHRSVAGEVGALLAEKRPARVSFVAKSLGTVALAALPAGIAAGAVVEAIWLTPIFGQAEVRTGARDRRWRSLLVAGEADQLHEAEHHESVRRSLGAASLVLPGADHSLEVPGDVMGTIDGLRALAGAVLEFAGRGAAP